MLLFDTSDSEILESCYKIHEATLVLAIMKGMRCFHQNSQSASASQKHYFLKAEITPIQSDLTR